MAGNKQDFVKGSQYGMVLKRKITEDGDVVKVDLATPADIPSLPASKKLELGTRIKEQDEKGLRKKR